MGWLAVVWWALSCCWAASLHPSRSFLLAAELDPVYWNSSNPLFHSSEGLVVYPRIGDRMDVVCPRVAAGPGVPGVPGVPGGPGGPGVPGVPGGPGGPAGPGEVEFFKLYLVTREQAERCSTMRGSPLLLTCNKPEQHVKYTVKFQEFSPHLFGLEFKRSHDYYVISTSDGTPEGLDNRIGGACQALGMKLVMKVGQADPLGDEASVEQGAPSSREHPDGSAHRPPADPPPDRDASGGPDGGGGGGGGAGGAADGGFSISSSGTTGSGSSNGADPSADVGGPGGPGGPGGGPGGPGGGPGGNSSSSLLGSQIALVAGVASGSVLFLVFLTLLVVALLRCRRRRTKHPAPASSQHHHHHHLRHPSAGGGGGGGVAGGGGGGGGGPGGGGCPSSSSSYHHHHHHHPLGSLVGSPKHGGVGVGGVGGTEPSDIIIPLRSAVGDDPAGLGGPGGGPGGPGGGPGGPGGGSSSSSSFCPHYEKVSGDYGHPVYIVQEIPPQSPSVYYKV